MSNSGIIRRIDELGRIVIPKEMRKSLRLQEGDEMQIFVENEGVLLKKYIGIESVLSSSKAIMKLLAEQTGATVLLCNSTEVISAFGDKKAEYRPKKLSETTIQLLKTRKPQVIHGEKLGDLFENHLPSSAYAISECVITNGDFMGALVLMLDTLPSDIARAYLHFAVSALSAVLE